MADVSQGALGRNRRSRLLHDRRVDVARLVTYYTVFVMDLASRRVHMLGSKRHPGDLFMGQIVRLATAADDGVLMGHRVLICDRDRKRSRAVRQRFGAAGIRAVLTPARAPNANAYAERFVRSIKEECLDRMIPLGERHFRRTHPLGPNLGITGLAQRSFLRCLVHEPASPCILRTSDELEARRTCRAR
jgi:transposase InsO family protein